MKHRSARAAARLGLVLFCLTLPANLLWAQNENETVGFQTNHIFESGQFGENIDTLNGGLNLSIPIGPRYQVSRFLSYQLQLAYGSKIWDHTRPPGDVDKLFRRSNLGLGFTMHFGRVYKDVELVADGVKACTWYYVSPDGNEHALPPMEGADSCLQLPLGTTVDRSYYSFEGFNCSSGSCVARWNGAPGPGNAAPVLRMYTPDARLVYEFGHMIQVFNSEGAPLNQKGTMSTDAYESDTNYNRDFGGWYVTKIYDYTSRDVGHPYGRNYVSIEYDLGGVPEEESDTVRTSHAIRTITDSLGRMITFTNGCAPADPPATGCQQIPIPFNNPERSSVRTISIAIPTFKPTTVIESPTTTQAEYTFEYAWRNVSNPDGIQYCSQHPSNCPSVNVLLDVVYPTFDNHAGTQPGYRMTFDYGSSDPLFKLLNGEIHARTLPTGAMIWYRWGEYYYLSGNTRQLDRKVLYLDPLNQIPAGTNSGEWNYTREAMLTGTALTNPKYVTVKDALGNETVYHYRASLQNPTPPPPGTLITDYEDGYSPEWDDGVNVRVEYYEGNGPSRKLIRAETHEYDADLSGIFLTKRKKDNVRETRLSTTYSDDGGRRASVEYRDWNWRGLWREKIESGDGIEGVRRTRTEYPTNEGDASVFTYREVSDGQKVLARTDNTYDFSKNLVLTIDHASLPVSIGTSDNLPANDGDLVKAYIYDADGNVVQKEMGNTGASQDGFGNWHATTPQYKISYGYQPGGFLVTKKFFDLSVNPPSGVLYDWFAIHRERDGNTGLIFSTRDTAGIETTYIYDVLGRVRDIQPAGSEELPTEVEYVSANLTAVRQGPGTTFDCDQQEISGDFLLTCYTFDSLGRLVKTQKRPANACSPYQTTAYDALGRTTFQSEWIGPDEPDCTLRSPETRGTIYDYGDPATFGQDVPRTADPFGRPRTVKTTDGQITETAYFGESAMVTVKGIASLSDGTPGAFDAITRYTRDVWGRLEEVLPLGGAGAKADYEYDLRDNLSQVTLVDPVNGAIQTRSFEYDALNRLRASVNPESGAETITGYDAAGNVTAKTDSSGNRTLMAYDGAGRPSTSDWQAYQKPGTGEPPIIPLQRNTYDGDPGEFGPSGGRLTSAESFDDRGTLVHTRKLYYQELNGRLSRERHLFRGWKDTAGDILDASIQYDYNSFGLVSRTGYPEGPAGMGGAFATLNNYSNGLLMEVWDEQVCQLPAAPTDPPGQACPRCVSGADCTPLARAAYSAAGGIQVVTTRGDVSTNIVPDDRNRPSRISIGSGVYDKDNDTYLGGNHYRSGLYGYDGAGNIKQIGANLYGYDATNRLIQAKVVGDSDPNSTTIREQTFLYDAFGNMTEKILRVNGADPPAADDVYTMTDQGGLTSNRIQQHRSGSTTYLVNYDARGNVALADGRVFEADSRNRLLSVRALGAGDKEIARYAYDGSASRVRKDDRGRDQWTFYVRDLQGKPLSEFRMTQWGSYTPEWAKHNMYLGSRLIGLRDNGIPSPPAGLGATVAVSGTTAYVTLSWRANPTGEGVAPSKYKVYRSANVTPPVWGTPVEVTTTIYVNTVAKGSSWKYSVTAAYVDAGVTRESYGSDVLFVKASLLAPRPGAPVGLTADPGDRRVFLTWTPNANAGFDNVLGYHVYRRVGSGSSLRLTQIPLVQTSFLDQGYSDGLALVNGTAYTYYVSAINSSNLESASNPEATATPSDYTPPGPPLGLKSAPACDGSSHVNLSWKLNAVGDAASYRLYRTPEFSAGPWLPMETQSSYTDLETAENQEYTYWVVAIDANQNSSEESLHVNVKTRAPSAVSAPGVPFVASGDGVVNVRVPIAAGDPVGGMRIYRKRNIDEACENYEPLDDADMSSSYGSYPDGTVTNNVAYDYVATYVNSAGESGFSKATLGLPVEAPSTFTECVQVLGNVTNWKDGAEQCIPDTGTGGSPYKRLLLRWQPVSAANYQPANATNAGGTLAYLMGYRIYSYEVPNYRDLGAHDAARLVPRQTDYEKPFCSAHPDIACGLGGESECPAGDTCIWHAISSIKGVCETSGNDCYNDSQCNGTVGDRFDERCVATTVGKCRDVPEKFCNVDAQCPGSGFLFGSRCEDNRCVDSTAYGPCILDSDCPANQKCVINTSESPYLTLYQDSGVNTFPRWMNSGNGPQGYDGSCLTATAVYRIYASGEWRVVESNYADNFDPSRQDQKTRCVETTLDMCNTADMTLADTTYPCGPVGTLPPTPGNLRVTLPAPQTIRLEWDAPGACEPILIVSCTQDADCQPGQTCGGTGICEPPYPQCMQDSDCSDTQYCRISSPDGWSGYCKFKDPAFCSDSVLCQGTDVVCESRESEVAGYYIYVGEKSVNQYHFKPGSPVTATDSATTVFEFQGLAPLIGGSTGNDFSFRVASFDRGGRISVLSVPTATFHANGTGGAVPAPGSVKTVIWTRSAPSDSGSGIRIKWLPGANYSSLAGYRVWRSPSETEPSCALMFETDPGTGQITTVCKAASSLGATEVTLQGSANNKTSFIDDTVQPGVNYYYRISAVLSGGQESPFSPPAAGLLLPQPALPLSAPDAFKAEAPLGVPFNASMTPEWAGIYLNWCPNAAREGVTGYNVYRSQTSMGPYTQDNLIATIPPVCLDGRHRCEISANKQVTISQAPACVTGINGSCKIVDTNGSGLAQTVKNDPKVYYYVVTALRDLGGGMQQESGFSKENQGRPNCTDCSNTGDTTWALVYDPDNFPEGICGEESAALQHADELIARAGQPGENELPPAAVDADTLGGDTIEAPYRVIGQGSGGGPTMPAAVPRFSFFHLNHLGSPIVITNASGTPISKHHYMPFGEEMPLMAQDTTNKRQFTGHERDDETGMDYMLARYYSSSLARFMAVDPGDDTALEDPQSWNKYAYVRNNPLIYTDPSGRNYTTSDGYTLSNREQGAVNAYIATSYSVNSSSGASTANSPYAYSLSGGLAGGMEQSSSAGSGQSGSPSNDPALADREVRWEMRKSWAQSNSKSATGRHEEGAYYGQEADGSMGYRRWPSGQQASIAPPPLTNGSYQGLRVQGNWHTHPNPPPWTQGASGRDLGFIGAQHYPGNSYIISRDSIYRISPTGAETRVGSRVDIL